MLELRSFNDLFVDMNSDRCYREDDGSFLWLKRTAEELAKQVDWAFFFQKKRAERALRAFWAAVDHETFDQLISLASQHNQNVGTLAHLMRLEDARNAIGLRDEKLWATLERKREELKQEKSFIENAMTAFALQRSIDESAVSVLFGKDELAENDREESSREVVSMLKGQNETFKLLIGCQPVKA